MKEDSPNDGMMADPLADPLGATASIQLEQERDSPMFKDAFTSRKLD
jgi:hypothetical protein